jgi:uncharacterized protein YebE (UPF0316 family)
MRIIFVARGYKLAAPTLGFFEISLWLFAAGVTMKNLDQWHCCAAFALGFTLGSYLGILIDKWLALGTVTVRIFTHRDAGGLVEQLRAANFGVTSVDAEGATGKVRIHLTVVKRKQLADVTALIDSHHPGAFYAIDELQSACEGIFPAARERPGTLPTTLWDAMNSVIAARFARRGMGTAERKQGRETGALGRADGFTA